MKGASLLDEALTFLDKLKKIVEEDDETYDEYLKRNLSRTSASRIYSQQT